MTFRDRALGWALAAVTLVGCGGGEGAAADQENGQAAVITLGPENIAVVDSARIQSGPLLSGRLAPVQSSSIRAQVAGTVQQVLAEAGQPVRKGEVLLRIESSSIREAYVSAQSGVRSAEAAYDVARRNYERAVRLDSAGAIAARDVEDARSRMINAEAAAADARARLVSAQRELSHTEVRAPFAGVISERPVNAGDVVQIGTLLVTVVDPSSMRLEASVPADQLRQVRVGAPVDFTVSGYEGRVFTGRVERISPAVDPATGQVKLYVEIPNSRQALVAGLYADGRVASEATTGLAVPEDALASRAASPTVVRLNHGVVEEVPVELGLRDNVAEQVEIVSGVAPGDTLLLRDAQSLAPGTRARVTRTASPPGGEH